MTLAALLSFFLVLYLRRTLKDTEPLPPWYRNLNYSLIAIAVLSVIQEVFHPGRFYQLVWPVTLFLTFSFILKQKEFASSRNLIVAVLPLAVISCLQIILEVWQNGFLEKISDYVEIAQPFAFIWLIAFFIMFRRQQKALSIERKKLEEEEKLHKVISARKDELETLVAERTAEIMRQKDELQHALDTLTATQSQLIQAEKMASLGELTAGIAHEIQNPLNFVNNFSEVNAELADELRSELSIGNMQLANQIAEDIKTNSEKINEHGKRADAIVKGMLQHSRTSTGQKELTDINELADEYLRLAYHGLRAKDKSFNAKFETDFDETLEKINAVPQDIGRVLLNLINNAFYSVTEKKKQQPDNYDPTVTVQTRKIPGFAEVRVRDNGAGIAPQVMEKIFQPFFTTKPSGSGTGLGLSLSYDIITKGHNGRVEVRSKEGEYAEFIIQLPT
jgi:C4-dicarboxylate-specific signal transduction histidine kinase